MSKWSASHCGQLSVIWMMIDCPSELQRPANCPPSFMQVISRHALQQRPRLSPGRSARDAARYGSTMPPCHGLGRQGRCWCKMAAYPHTMPARCQIAAVLQRGAPAALAWCGPQRVAGADCAHAPVGPLLLGDGSVPARALRRQQQSSAPSLPRPTHAPAGQTRLGRLCQRNWVLTSCVPKLGE